MEFYESIESSLSSLDFDRFRREFYADSNNPHRNEMSWDLALLFMTRLSESKTDELTKCLEEANLDLSRRSGSPKELFMVYLQNGEYFLGHEKNFTHFLDLIEALFIRSKSPKFIACSLEQVLDFLDRYSKNSSNDLSVRRRFIALIGSLVHENDTSENVNIKKELDRSLTILLINNVKILIDKRQTITINSDDLSQHEEEIERDHVELVSNICSMIRKMNANTLQLLIDLMNTNIIDSLYEYSLSLYACLIVSPSQFGLIPCVYEKFYIYRTLLTPINHLLSASNKPRYIEIALECLTTLLEVQETGPWNETVLELDSIAESVELLLKVSIYSQEEKLRRLSGRVLKSLFSKLNRLGRFEYLRTFLNRHLPDLGIDQSADYICSYLVYLLKEEINECFNRHEDFYYSNNRYFSTLFNMIFNNSMLKNEKTSQNPQTLAQQSTLINAELNLLRFVLLRDKSENRTKIYDMLKASRYLKWLQDLCKLARMTSEHELKEETNCDRKRTTATESSQLQVRVNDKEIKEPTKAEMVAAISASLRTIDIVDCLRVRVEEILNENS